MWVQGMNLNLYWDTCTPKDSQNNSTECNAKNRILIYTYLSHSLKNSILAYTLESKYYYSSTLYNL